MLRSLCFNKSYLEVIFNRNTQLLFTIINGAKEDIVVDFNP